MKVIQPRHLLNVIEARRLIQWNIWRPNKLGEFCPKFQAHIKDEINMKNEEIKGKSLRPMHPAHTPSASHACWSLQSTIFSILVHPAMLLRKKLLLFLCHVPCAWCTHSCFCMLCAKICLFKAYFHLELFIHNYDG